MEGRWRGVVARVAAGVVVCAWIAGASGCGDGDSSAVGPDAVRTASPEGTFAPLVEVAAGEPWRPMSARWFIERSALWFAEDDGCADRKIAVGHALPEQQNPRIDWIYPTGLGDGPDPNYYREPYDARCEFTDRNLYTDQLTRPNDPGPRIEGARPGEGYYLDLVDAARGGPRADGAAPAPAYVERTDEGDSVVRLTYWMLFGMHGRPGAAGAHEGDWERVDVLLRADGDRYEPRAIQLGGGRSETAWGATRRVGGTHPVVTGAAATHTMTAAPAGESCADCVPLETWRSLADAREQPWYGFGGAWGQLGATSATTGPLGPHRFWSSAADKRRDGSG